MMILEISNLLIAASLLGLGIWKGIREELDVGYIFIGIALLAIVNGHVLMALRPIITPFLEGLL